MARNMTRWEPRRDLVSMQDMFDRFFDRAFEDWFFRPLMDRADGEGMSMAVDMYETEAAVVVRTAIPGVKAEDIDVSVTGDSPTIKAEAREEREVKDENYLRRERRLGTYRRSVTLPAGLETDRVNTDYADGVLTLEFPKSEEIKPKTIKVRSGESRTAERW